MEISKLVAGLIALPFCIAIVAPASAQDQFTVDATRQPSPPLRGRGPFPGSATAGHSAGLPIRLDLLTTTGELKGDGTMPIDFRITNAGSELINLPVSVYEGSFLAQLPDTNFTLDILTLWLTPDAISDELELKGPDGQVHRLKTASPTTSAELYGRSDDPHAFYALAPGQSIIVHASSRAALQPGTHSLTAHAELAREFIGSNNASPPSRHVTSKLIGTADAEPQTRIPSRAMSAAP